MLRLSILLACFVASAAAMAAQSEPAVTEGGSVRLVVEDGMPTGGTLRGALVIALKPGWKTYWRDPGDAGIPPTIEASGDGVTAAAFRFPAPRRFDDGVSVWAGYDRPVTLPVVLTLAPGASAKAIDAHVFLGICEEICIPVDAKFSFKRAEASGPDSATIDAAFSALPKPATSSQGVAGVHVDGKSVMLDLTTAPAELDASLFLAAPPGWTFSAPKTVAGSDGRRFSFKIQFRPKDTGAGSVPVSYTLVDGAASIEGTFTLP